MRLKTTVKMSKNYLLVSVLLLLATVFIVSALLCKSSVFQDKQKRDNKEESMTISPSSKEIIIDILFNVYQKTDFDNNIGRSAILTNRNVVIDQRQYREGYIYMLKRSIMGIDTETMCDIISRNRTSVKKKTKIIVAGNDLDCDGPVPFVNTSTFYQYGLTLASEHVYALHNRAWEEVKRVSSKYRDIDNTTWLSHNGTEELSKRLKEAPHLQAIIFLQNKIKNSPEVQVARVASVAVQANEAESKMPELKPDSRKNDTKAEEKSSAD